MFQIKNQKESKFDFLSEFGFYAVLCVHIFFIWHLTKNFDGTLWLFVKTMGWVFWVENIFIAIVLNFLYSSSSSFLAVIFMGFFVTAVSFLNLCFLI